MLFLMSANFFVPVEEAYTDGAEHQNKHKSEHMEGRIVGRSGPPGSTFGFFIFIAQPLQQRCFQDFGGDTRPGIWNCRSISQEKGDNTGKSSLLLSDRSPEVETSILRRARFRAARHRL